jgi:uncharacterized membrane protein YoaK (UPF0700 family)
MARGRPLRRTEKVAVALAATLTAAAGAVDALTYWRLGNVFSSAMTGNIALFGISAAHPNGTLLRHVVTAFAGYAVGVVIAGRFTGGVMGSSAAWPARATLAFAGELVFLLALLVLGQIAAQPPRGSAQYALLVLAAVAMGMQSGAYRSLNIAGVLGSTYLTGNLVVWLMAVSHRRPDWSGLASLVALLVGALIESVFIFHVPRLATIFPALLVGATVTVAASPGFRHRASSVSASQSELATPR